MRQRTIRLAATGARIATGAVVAAGCVLGVLGAVAAPLPVVQNQAHSTTVRPVPGDTTLLCNGSFRALGRDSARADLMVSAAVPQLWVDQSGDAPETQPLAMPDVEGGMNARMLTSVVTDREAHPIAASESVRLDAEDARGFAAAPCREASMHTWLVGGDVTTGASDVIVLSNPGDVPATVDFTVYGEERAASTTVVPARTQLGVALSAIAAGEQRPVVEVASSGAPVRAALQSTLVRTLDPVGIDLQDGVGGPQEDLRIVGVQAQTIDEGDDATGVVVRMLSPELPADAVVRVRAAGSPGVVDEYPVALEPGRPTEMAISGIATGVYDIEVVADQPVVAAARQTARAGAQTDFAWMTPAPEIPAELMFSVPNGPAAVLEVRNAQDVPVTVELSGAQNRTIQLPASGSASVRVRAGGYTLDPSGPVHAAVTMRGGEGSASIAGWPLWPGAATEQPIVVVP